MLLPWSVCLQQYKLMKLSSGDSDYSFFIYRSMSKSSNKMDLDAVVENVQVNELLNTDYNSSSTGSQNYCLE